MESKVVSRRSIDTPLLSVEFKQDSYRIFLEHLSSGDYKAIIVKSGHTFPVASHDIQGLPRGSNLSLLQLKAFFEQATVMVRRFSNQDLGLSFGFALKGAGNVVNDKCKLWSNGIIPYVINAEDFPLNSHCFQQVIAAIQHWNEKTNIYLRPRVDHDQDYIDIIKHSASYSTEVGRAGGRQFIQCETNDSGISTGSLIHEIGRAVGLLHEHTRVDRNQYVKVHWENIQGENKHNFNLAEQALPYGGYDFYSIMHYSMFAFSNNGFATITAPHALPRNFKYGQRNGLSQCDIAAVNYLVERSRTQPVIKAPPAARVSTEILFHPSESSELERQDERPIRCPFECSIL